MSLAGKKKAPSFDDKALAAAEILLENFWIIREKAPEMYQLVVERQHALRGYFLDKAGFHLIIHRHFVKLEKIPAEPESWMGVSGFTHYRDYVLFCCLMAYLESKSVDEQFLLSDLCEAMQSNYPGDEGPDWTNYGHRKSLVRVMQYATDIGLVEVVEGDVVGFGSEESHEVLYEVPPVSRYFMPSYPKELPVFDNLEEILSGEWRDMRGLEYDESLKRRHRVYRQLLLSPVMYAAGPADPDYLYLRNFRHRIREDIETHTGYIFELYAGSALLTSPEKRGRLTLFPGQRALDDMVMQLSALLRRRLRTGGPEGEHGRDDFRETGNEHKRNDFRETGEENSLWETDRAGRVSLTPVEFENLMQELKEKYGAGWSKQYREALIPEIAGDMLQCLQEWKMAEQNRETGVISLLPLLGRTVCHYPEDFPAKV